MGPDLDLDLDLEPPRPEIIENHRSETIGGIAGGPDPESSPGGARTSDWSVRVSMGRSGRSGRSGLGSGRGGGKAR